jgi:HSP20 family molecular chaperone IbpA
MNEKSFSRSVFYGKFKTDIALPKHVTYDEVNGKYKKGLLEIRLTKKEEQKDTDIDIDFTEEES